MQISSKQDEVKTYKYKAGALCRRSVSQNESFIWSGSTLLCVLVHPALMQLIFQGKSKKEQV